MEKWTNSSPYPPPCRGCVVIASRGGRRVEKVRQVNTFIEVGKREDQEISLFMIFIGLRERPSGKDFFSSLIPKP
jgi:hypothetical protein